MLIRSSSIMLLIIIIIIIIGLITIIIIIIIIIIITIIINRNKFPNTTHRIQINQITISNKQLTCITKFKQMCNN